MIVKTAKPAKKLTLEFKNGIICAFARIGSSFLLYEEKEVSTPMHTPIEKKI